MVLGACLTRRSARIKKMIEKMKQRGVASNEEFKKESPAKVMKKGRVK